MERKESSFMARKEWLELPWRSVQKSAFDRLLDLVLQAPALIRRGEDIGKAGPDCQGTLAAQLFNDCLELDRQLEEFYGSIIEEADRPIFWPVPSNQDQPWMPRLRYEFIEYDVATTVILKWACSLMVRSGLCALPGLLTYFTQVGALPETENVDITMSDIRDLPKLAQNILQAGEYCLDKESNGLRAPAICAPLAITIETLREWPHCQNQYQSARQALQFASSLGFKMLWPPISEIG